MTAGPHRRSFRFLAWILVHALETYPFKEGSVRFSPESHGNGAVDGHCGCMRHRVNCVGKKVISIIDAYTTGVNDLTNWTPPYGFRTLKLVFVFVRSSRCEPERVSQMDYLLVGWKSPSFCCTAISSSLVLVENWAAGRKNHITKSDLVVQDGARELQWGVGVQARD